MKNICKNCSKQFEAERSNQIYCSNSCKSKAYQNRKNEKEIIAINSTPEKIKVSLNKYEEVMRLLKKIDKNSYWTIFEYCFFLQNVDSSVSAQSLIILFECLYKDGECEVYDKCIGDFGKVYFEKFEIVE